ncbi:helix-turn-helix domain-containing protein [Streptomyces hoynatensis]|uniref:helix-turn-helix domain-containing protein n=1 Tax=Streptomyces hoynatensis TaxID=1141874 RepID=UPI003BAAB460
MSNNAQQAREVFGARLRELRKEKGLTGRTLANAAGWHLSKVSRIEHGISKRSPNQTCTPDAALSAPKSRFQISSQRHATSRPCGSNGDAPLSPEPRRIKNVRSRCTKERPTSASFNRPPYGARCKPQTTPPPPFDRSLIFYRFPTTRTKL